MEPSACKDPCEAQARTISDTEKASRAKGGANSDETSRDVAAAPPPAPILTNLDKLFWPDDGYTKGDLVEYYRSVSPWLLPYLADRPVVLTRFPDGIDGKQFFQKDAPPSVPSWVRTEAVWSESAQRELRYVVCDSAETLVYLANLGTIPLHIAASRFANSESPDWCVLDLDPKDAAFADVIQIAKGIHKLCDEIGLEHFVKTSGASGLHVLIPLAGLVTFEQSKQLAQVLSQVVAQRFPAIATLNRSPRQREGKVYLDALQNGPGKLIAAPLCVRPVPGAQVSMPLRWRDVKGGKRAPLDPAQFRIANAVRRLRKIGDPMEPLLKLEPNLATALETLAALLD